MENPNIPNMPNVPNIGGTPPVLASSSRNKWMGISIAVVLLVLGLAAGWFFYGKTFFAPVGEQPAAAPVSNESGSSASLESDTTAQIGQDIDSIDLGNVDQDTGSLDSDLNQL